MYPKITITKKATTGSQTFVTESTSLRNHGFETTIR